MDYIGPAIEGVLVVLLIAALLYGMRLDRKLNALRQTQAGFAEAVRTLDQAAARAETGLDTLRRAAEDTQDGLQGRIVKARELKAELESLIARAERAAANAPAPQATVPDRATPRKLELAAPEQRRSRVNFSAPAVDEEAPLELTEPIGKAPRPHIPPPTTKTSPRRSAARGLDEDLFDNPPTGSGRGRRIFGAR